MNMLNKIVAANLAALGLTIGLALAAGTAHAGSARFEVAQAHAAKVMRLQPQKPLVGPRCPINWCGRR